MPFNGGYITNFTWENLASTWSELFSTWIGEYDPVVTVELGAFTGFTLDDPVLGVLDTGVLDGSISFVDVTSSLFSTAVNRGRNRDLERTNSGRASLSLRNEDRRFDPSYSQSPLLPYLVPRKPIRVKADGLPVFTGLIDDWNFTYSMGGKSDASIESSDAFSLFAREETSGVSVSEELSGARIEAVLDDAVIPWPSLDRDIDTGDATLAAGTLEGNSLTYLQDVETSEAGLIFMTKDGKFAFRQRLIQPVTDALTFADDGTGISYDDIQITYGTELLANSVVVTSSAGTATASDALSQELYGVTEKSINSLLASGSLQGLADFILARYKVPEYRIDRIRVNMNSVAAASRASLLSLELGDQADVIFTPNNFGDTIAIRNRIIGISHDVSPDSHYVFFNFEALPFEFFILDDGVFGKLDDEAGVLGF